MIVIGLLRDALRKEQLAHDSKSRFMAHVSHGAFSLERENFFLITE